MRRRGSPGILWNAKVSGSCGRAPRSYRPWYRPALALVRQIGVRDCSVLDLGCGAGEFSCLLSELGARVVACDGDPVTLARVKAQNPPFDVREADCEQPLPFADAAFSCVTLLEVIEHIGLAERLLGEICRVLKPGGHLVLSTPNFAWLVDRFRYLWGRFPRNEGVHVRFFTKRSLERMIRQSGFEVLRRRSFTPLVGVNRALRLCGFRHRAINVHVPCAWEGVFALDFVWLLRKQ